MLIEVMLVDDHSIVRQGIKSIISQEPDIAIVAEASNGRDAIAAVNNKKPDVIIMDITMPFLNGLEAANQIIKKHKNVKIVILSMHEDRVFIEKALSCGAKGYILKDSAIDEIVRAIREVQSGGYFLSSKISSFVVQDFVKRRQSPMRLKSAAILTNRETEILQLVSEGLNSKEIAQKLNLALKTVLAHRNNIMQKLNIHNQAQLIRFALKEGVTSL